MPATDLNHPCPHCYTKQNPDAHLCGSPVASWCDEYILEAYYRSKILFDWITKTDEGKISDVESHLDDCYYGGVADCYYGGVADKRHYHTMREECEKRGLI